MAKQTWMAVMAMALACGWAAGCGDPAEDDTTSQVDSETDTQIDTDSESDTQTATDSDTGPSELLGFEITDRVEFQTSMGTFVLALFGDDAPITTQNFLTYVDEGFFDDLVFHRVIPDFMIQGGGYDVYLDHKAGHDPIDLEIVEGLSHQPGVISMARAEAPKSATSEFFICVADDSPLDGDYAAFGATLSGYDVVEAISLVETRTAGMFEDVPVEPVLIESAVRL